jgi:hypothetical protein
MLNFIKFRPARAELFHADGPTDRQTRDEANSRFFAVLRTLQILAFRAIM